MLKFEECVEVGLPFFLILRQDHTPHHVDTVSLEKHMLGAAKTDTLGAQLSRFGGVLRCFGVGAHLQASVFVCP